MLPSSVHYMFYFFYCHGKSENGRVVLSDFRLSSTPLPRSPSKRVRMFEAYERSPCRSTLVCDNRQPQNRRADFNHTDFLAIQLEQQVLCVLFSFHSFNRLPVPGVSRTDAGDFKIFITYFFLFLRHCS